MNIKEHLIPRFPELILPRPFGPLQSPRAGLKGTPRLRRPGISRKKTRRDSYGHAPFDFAKEARAVAEQPGVFDVAGMRVGLPPAQKECGQCAMSTVLSALQQLYLCRADWKPNGKGGYAPVSLCLWVPEFCTVTFRANIDDHVIRATYCTNDHLEISLPPKNMWAQCGLGWQDSYVKCCDRHFLNPRPWLQEPCGCDL